MSETLSTSARQTRDKSRQMLSLVLLCMLGPLGAMCMRPVALPTTTSREGHGQEEDAWRGGRGGAVEGLRGWDAGRGRDEGSVFGPVLEGDAQDTADVGASIIVESRASTGRKLRIFNSGPGMSCGSTFACARY